MKSFAQALDLNPDPTLIEAYKGHHRAVWPEVTAALRSIGISRMQIFLAGNRLFMYVEVPDGFVPERDFQRFTQSPRGAEWDRLMRTYQQRVPGAGAGEWWTPLELVFDLDWSAPDR